MKSLGEITRHLITFCAIVVTTLVVLSGSMDRNNGASRDIHTDCFWQEALLLYQTTSSFHGAAKDF